ncbi:MAG TPA: response regulator transcription factor, partial [Paludibacter sp.]|nr:response regulator transcription factor [Paludibacter sp.]
NDYDVIATAILTTVSGKKYYCSEALQIIMDGHNRKKENSLKRNLLTSTELELVQLFTQGKTAKEIAEMRCLSHHTINTHRKNIFRKLNLNNIQELIKFALKNGLVDLTEYYI